jgi:hypothetical protein
VVGVLLFAVYAGQPASTQPRDAETETMALVLILSALLAKLLTQLGTLRETRAMYMLIGGSNGGGGRRDGRSWYMAP